MKRKTLPENVPTVSTPDKLDLTRCANLTGLIYMLTDVCYQMLYDLCIEYQHHGQDLRHETKYRFNRFFTLLQQARDAALRCDRDISAMNESSETAFFEDTEFLREIIELIYNKTLDNEENQTRIRALVFNLKNDKGCQ